MIACLLFFDISDDSQHHVDHAEHQSDDRKNGAAADELYGGAEQEHGGYEDAGEQIFIYDTNLSI